MTEKKVKLLPKIVRIFSRLNIGGPAIHVVLLSKKLSPKYETILVTGKIGPSEGDMSYLLNAGDPFHHVFIPELGRNIHIWKDLIAFWKIFRLLCRYKPDIIHTHTAKAGLLGRLAAILARVPIRVHTFHGHLFSHYFHPFKTGLLLVVERWLSRLTSAIVAISESQKRELVQKFKIAKASKIEVVQLGFDLPCHSEQSEESRRDLRQKFNLPSDCFCVGIVGRLILIKNHSAFLRIAKETLKHKKGVHFLMVGDGECRGDLVRQIAELDMQDQVSLISWQKELKSLYDLFDVVCLTSLNEGTPVSLIEAQACGKPVVAFRAGGIEDVVSDHQSGYLIPLNDERLFAEKILFLLDHPEKRREMGEFGKKRVFENFHEKRLVREVDQLYQRLLSIDGRPGV